MIAASRSIAALADLQLTRDEILADYRLGWESRQASLIGRREVMAGKAKFGIFGDGKEVPQIALAKTFKPGDFRSGYYRDQTLMFALGISSIHEHFAQLYAHADRLAEPATGGRQMNAHYSTRLLDDEGRWIDLTAQPNTSGDLSPTGSQMPRLVGLAYASCLFRKVPELAEISAGFSVNGNEVAFGTIGNASCAEGMFWESINAIGVLGAPAVISIWDDDYGISVPNERQVTKGDLSSLLSGFARENGSGPGFDLYVVNGWDYPELVRVYREAVENARRDHVPALVHVRELTQPQGHSTSGSHERYKTPERLAWETEYDCLRQMRRWILQSGIAGEEELDRIEGEARALVEGIRAEAWENYQAPIRSEVDEFTDILAEISASAQEKSALEAVANELRARTAPLRSDIMVAAHSALVALRESKAPSRQILADWRRRKLAENDLRYGSELYSPGPVVATEIDEVAPVYSPDSAQLPGFQIMNACFADILARDRRVVAFGEDLGKIGDVNQGFAGLQERFGDLRVADTGIREATILGQAIGLAMRGLRPIAEIQYLDYLLYALQIMSDDLATLRWRTAGGQAAPVIVRTRGHRLEGVWHSGSLMAGIFNLLHGMHVLVPRNMVQAAGFYNTLLASDDPGLVVEVLNGYRVKERLPDNLGEVRVPLGVPEVLREGRHVTLVTYGASCRIAMAAAERLAGFDIDIEVIDVRALLPFDVNGMIARSLEKTSRIVFMDEDVPGGTTAYMLQQVLEVQGGYRHLDTEPRTLPGKPHRPAYGSDGNYWSKPNTEGVFEGIYHLMHEAAPIRYPIFF
ncbi:MAG TPA: thiamine pyrophosphate-dependent enzyme [Anaerolineales bacterium]|nr:thiamine pyrophosphate-dependent enzyme [Anaerolineales bacterium]